MHNPSQTRFDEQFFEIPHLKAFPALLPFVGQNYTSDSHCRCLLVGESFYFPDDSTIHQNAEAWYEATQQDLNEYEISYMNCRGLLECDWGSPGHEIYREINRRLGDLPLEAADRPVAHIAFMNAFFRPAEIPGESFKFGCKALDFEIAAETMTKIITILEPDLVVFVSKWAWDTVGWKVAEALPNIAFEFTSHPATPFWWNRAGYPHGRKKFDQILRDRFANSQIHGPGAATP